MSRKREDLLSIIDTSLEDPSLSYWCSILNFFSQYKNILDLHDMEIICTESERCRLYWNSTRTETIQIRRAGDIVEQEKVINGLGIQKDDVLPKIYDHLAELQIDEDEEIHTEQPKTISETPVDVIPMSAAPKE